MFTEDLKFVKEHNNYAKLQPPRAKLKCKFYSVFDSATSCFKTEEITALLVPYVLVLMYLVNHGGYIIAGCSILVVLFVILKLINNSSS